MTQAPIAQQIETENLRASLSFFEQCDLENMRELDERIGTTKQLLTEEA